MKAKITDDWGGLNFRGKRVPEGEPGFRFFKSRTAGKCMSPLQKGHDLKNPEMSIEYADEELPRWMDRGDYITYSVEVTEEMREPKHDHIVVALRQGRPHVWLVQDDVQMVGEEAMRFLPDFDWSSIAPMGPAMVASRVLNVASGGMFPDLDWVLVARVGKDRKVYASSPAYQALVTEALDRVAAEN